MLYDETNNFVETVDLILNIYFDGSMITKAYIIRICILYKTGNEKIYLAILSFNIKIWNGPFDNAIRTVHKSIYIILSTFSDKVVLILHFYN